MKFKFLSILIVLTLCLSCVLTALAQPQEKITWSKKHGTPEFIAGELTSPSNEDPETILFDYLTNNRDNFKRVI